MIATIPAPTAPALIIPIAPRFLNQLEIQAGAALRRGLTLAASHFDDTFGNAAVSASATGSGLEISSSLFRGLDRAVWATATPIRMPVASPRVTATSSSTGFTSINPPTTAMNVPRNAAKRRTKTTPRYGFLVESEGGEGRSDFPEMGTSGSLRLGSVDEDGMLPMRGSFLVLAGSLEIQFRPKDSVNRSTW
jgi:hypothetical protein